MAALEPRGIAGRGKFKILCLHGIGTNAEIFEAQTDRDVRPTASLRYHLGSPTAYDFDFVDGAHPWPPYPGILDIFGPQQICLSYFDGSASSSLAALDDLATHLIENGPFDAVMGFSMGGAMAATLLLQPQNPLLDKPEWVRARAMVHSAVFLCATLPVDVMELRRGEMAWIKLQDVGPCGKLRPISIPTVHAWSPGDVDNPGESKALVSMCDASERVEILHSAGHGVPSNRSEITAISSAIRKMLHSMRN
ncbi:hypothetical protein VMCG_00851 [Cytospora schulzeri]|uniref:Serine hydrolase domain-containing protein n=1 Tax=Cytospora schulzeri TaxID=448051 RepID=A0A423X5B7_9PEZI|nr:hypothetical protein VMCG_00851 [Valsa malicola]